MDNKSRKKSKKKVVFKTPADKNHTNLSRDEVRSIKKKKKNKMRKLRMRIFTFLLALVVICVGVILVFSVFFKINNVTISGDKVYSEKMIEDKSGIEIGSNLFIVSEEKLSEKLSKELPYIKSVTVERKLPDTIIINVTAAKEVAAITTENGFVLLDETGKVLDKNASILKENVAVLNNVKLKECVEGAQVVFTNENKNEVFVKLFEAIKNVDMQLLTEVDLKDVNNVKIRYDDRITFEVGNLTNIETKLARGLAALEKENEINAYAEGTLDLKTEPYVYFKSGSEEAKDKKSSKK